MIPSVESYSHKNYDEEVIKTMKKKPEVVEGTAQDRPAASVGDEGTIVSVVARKVVEHIESLECRVAKHEWGQAQGARCTLIEQFKSFEHTGVSDRIGGKRAVRPILEENPDCFK